MGSTRPGDVLAEVGGVVVSDMSFDKVRGMFETLRVVLDFETATALLPWSKAATVPLFERCVHGAGRKWCRLFESIMGTRARCQSARVLFVKPLSNRCRRKLQHKYCV